MIVLGKWVTVWLLPVQGSAGIAYRLIPSHFKPWLRQSWWLNAVGEPRRVTYWRSHGSRCERCRAWQQSASSDSSAIAATAGTCAAFAPLTHTHTHTRPFNGPLSGTTRVSQYKKGNTNLDSTEARSLNISIKAMLLTSLLLDNAKENDKETDK